MNLGATSRGLVRDNAFHFLVSFFFFLKFLFINFISMTRPSGKLFIGLWTVCAGIDPYHGGRDQKVSGKRMTDRAALKTNRRRERPKCLDV